MNRMIRFLKSEDGPTTVEYAVLLAGILVVVISGVTLVGGGSASFWSNNRNQIESAIGATDN